MADLGSGISLLLPLIGTNQTNLKRVDKGTGPLSFTRATTATRLNPATDLIESVASGDLREDGRDYLNRLYYSEDFSQSNWAKSNVTVASDNVTAPNGKAVAQSITASLANGTCLQTVTDISAVRYGSIYLKRKTGSGNIQVTLDGGATWTTVAVTGEWMRLGASQTLANPSFGVRIVTGGDAVYAWGAQLEDAAAATRYKKSGSSPAYAPKGVLIEGQRTNLLLYSRDMTNAAWAKTTMTAAFDQTGEDGVANSASSLLATGPNATCLQALTVASASFSGSISIKRLIGTGAVSITLDGGTTWIDVTTSLSASAWYRALKENQTLANPSFGIKLAVSSDKVAVDYAGVEQAVFASSRIPTTSAAVTRNNDVLKAPSSGNIADSTGTVILQLDSHSFVSRLLAVYLVGWGGAVIGVTAPNVLQSYDGTTGMNFGTLSNEAVHKVGNRWVGSSRCLVNDGTVSPNTSYDGSWNGGAYITFGAYQAAGEYSLFGHIKNLVIFNRALSDAEMIAITS